MSTPAAICPRCHYEAHTADAVAVGRFCPRCGLADYASIRPEAPDAPALELTVNGLHIIVGKRFALGDTCNLYHCRIGTSAQSGVFKIARNFRGNHSVQSGHETLQRLHAADVDGRAAPFLPKPIAITTYRSPDLQPGRVASMLGYHESINSATELYSLAEVRAAYPAGVDPKHLAWMWRRLLTVLGFAHASRVLHSAVKLEHVLIEPREHKLVLIGWSSAVTLNSDWRAGGLDASPLRADLAAAAGMVRLLAPSDIDPALVRYFDRAQSSSDVDASSLLADFDRLIDAMWGPRTFVPFEMPSRSTFKPS